MGSSELLFAACNRDEMGNSCVKPKIAPVSTEGAKRKGGSVASGSAASRNKRGNASEAGAEYRNEVLLKLKQNAGSNSVTGVHAALGVEYIRMENKLLQKNVDRVLSMVGKDGRTVRYTNGTSRMFFLKSEWGMLTANRLHDTAMPQVTTTISLKLALREEDCLKTPAECMIIDAAFSMENGRLSKAEERRQVRCSSSCTAHVSLSLFPRSIGVPTDLRWTHRCRR